MTSSLLSAAVLAMASLLPVSRAAILYEGATVIAFNQTDEKLTVLREASVLIEGDTITAVQEGRIADLPPNTTRIDATDKIVGTGYVDTHHHLWQTAFRTLGSNTTLAEYFQRYSEYGPAVQHYTPEDVYIGQLAGILELLHEGTTTVLDHAHASWSDETVDAGLNATLDGGVRAVFASAIHPLGMQTTLFSVAKR